MKSLNVIDLQKKQKAVASTSSPVNDECKKLLDLVKLYRKQEEAYFDKIKRQEFAKDEKHHMMKTCEKLDYLLSTIIL